MAIYPFKMSDGMKKYYYATLSNVYRSELNRMKGRDRIMVQIFDKPGGSIIFEHIYSTHVAVPDLFRIPRRFLDSYHIRIIPISYRQKAPPIVGRAYVVPKSKQSRKTRSASTIYVPEIADTSHKARVHLAKIIKSQTLRTPFSVAKVPTRARPASEQFWSVLPDKYEQNGSIVWDRMQPFLMGQRGWSGTVTPGYGGKRKTELPENPFHLLDIQTRDFGWVNEFKTLPLANSYITLSACSSTWAGTGVSPPLVTHDLSAYDKALSRLQNVVHDEV